MKRLASISILCMLATMMLQAASSANIRHLCPPRVAVIMAQYTDVQFKTASTTASFGEFFNGTNYNFEGATGSVQKYFNDQSYGIYVPQFDIIGPVTLPHGRSYYGANDESDEDAAADEMVADACNLAESLADFTQYDSDGDGVIDAVVVLYAGTGEVNGLYTESVWPYTGDMETSDYPYSVVLDGKTVSMFCAVSEMENPNHRAGIGTFVHEFAHILGLPNMCTTNNGDWKTLGDWDVMDHGCSNNRSRTPAGFSAYERFYMGWLEPILLNEPMNVRLRELGASGDCAIITASGQSNMSGISPDPREFYILENRQQTGWDTYIPGHGMMLTKLDFVKGKWESDEVNNVSGHPCVDLIEADGSAPKYKYDNLTNGYFGKQGDLFPSGASSKQMFSNKWGFSNVREQDGVVLLDFQGGVNRCKVNFSVSNGSPAYTSQTETAKNAGVVLPSVTPNSKYTFLGWSTRKNSSIADAGQPGDTFYPMSDCTVFAIMQDNSKYYAYYDWKGVTIDKYIGWNGYSVTVGNIPQNIAVNFLKKPGYEAPTADNCYVKVESGGIIVPNSYRFDGDTVIVTIPGSAITGDVYFTVLNLVREQDDNGCIAYSHTFTSSVRDGTRQDFGGYDWDVAIANTGYLNYDNTKGAIFGSGTYPALSVKLSTNETLGCGVKSVTVSAAANDESSTLQVFLGGNQIGQTIYLESALQSYTFVADEAQSGILEIRLTNEAKAMYLKQIQIDYELLQDDIEDAIEEVVSESVKHEWHKVMHDGQLLIIHNGHAYNILGAKVK